MTSHTKQVILARRLTAQQMESISLKRDKFHGDWNYSLAPK